jgi:uncharacterized protein YbjT (DUF2867 family)
MKKIIITGATGTVGQALLPNLLKHNVRVVALTRSPEKIQERSDRLKIVQADLRDQASYADALAGADTAYLLTDMTAETEILQNQFIDACRAQGVSLVVKQSAMGAAADSPVSMFRTHAAIEQHLKASGVAYCLLQPNSFSQNLLAHSQSVKTQGAIYAPMGDGKVSYVDARDVARVAATVLADASKKYHNKTYVLTGPEAVSMQESADVIGMLIGKKVSYYPVSYEQGKEAMMNFGMDEWLVDDLVATARLGAEGKARKVTENVENITGTKPTTLNESLSDYQASFA